DGKLQDGNVCIWVHVCQYRPSAMVDAPLITIQADPLGFNHLGDFSSKLSISYCWILKIKQRLWKTIKIMDGSGFVHCSDCSSTEIPMRGYDQQGLGSWHALPKC